MTLNAIALALHVLSAVVWVGGMFFAYMALRPVAGTLLEPPQRLTLWAQTFARFFPWVWLSVVLILVTGYWMVFQVFGGFDGARPYIHIMQGLGILMVLIYLHVFFAPYRRLQRSTANQDWSAGGKALNQIRKLVGLNLILGLLVVAVASGGRFL